MLVYLVRTAALCGVLALPLAARAATLEGFAAMGASETQGTDHKGSWVPWLAVDKKLNFGPGQTYNVAIGGSKTTDLLADGQHTEVAGLVDDGNVDLAFLFIGGLDVPPVSAQILAGTLNVPVWANGIVNNILTAVDEVLDENPQGMVISGLPDMRLVPGALSKLPPEFSVPVINAINVVNTQLKAEVLDRGLVYVDIATAMQDMYASPPVVGGVAINMTTGSGDPDHFYQDNIHPGYVGNGFFANLMLTALNEGYDAKIPLFTDQQILAKASLSGSYTGETSNFDYSKYIFTAVPEPSTLALSVVGATAALGFAARRRIAS
jgi:hypothetical protein